MTATEELVSAMRSYRAAWRLIKPWAPSRLADYVGTLLPPSLAEDFWKPTPAQMEYMAAAAQVFAGALIAISDDIYTARQLDTLTATMAYRPGGPWSWWDDLYVERWCLDPVDPRKQDPRLARDHALAAGYTRLRWDAPHQWPRFEGDAPPLHVHQEQHDDRAALAAAIKHWNQTATDAHCAGTAAMVAIEAAAWKERCTHPLGDEASWAAYYAAKRRAKEVGAAWERKAHACRATAYALTHGYRLPVLQSAGAVWTYWGTRALPGVDDIHICDVPEDPDKAERLGVAGWAEKRALDQAEAYAPALEIEANGGIAAHVAVRGKGAQTVTKCLE